MAHSKSTNTYNRQNWEDAEFPILCQTCLGENPYLRMMKERYGKECKICTRPFTVFRWCPGPKSRFKKTEVCQTCAKIRNVCQTCILDLQYGLPVEVRDKALKINDRLPKSEVGREYYMQQVERALADDPTAPWQSQVAQHALTAGGSGGGGGGAGPSGALATLGAGGGGGKAPAPSSDMLHRLARTTPYYKRNRPHICSFYVKGECRRGEECPYRHERPTDPDDPLSEQNIRDRYYGTNDPVAEKLMTKYSAIQQQREEAAAAALEAGGPSAGSAGDRGSSSKASAGSAGAASSEPLPPGVPSLLPGLPSGPGGSGGSSSYPSQDPARMGGFSKR